MTTHVCPPTASSTCTSAPATEPTPAASGSAVGRLDAAARGVDLVAPDVDAEGWQALALAELGRPLGPAELAAAERLPTAQALDLLFPALSPESRHEALSALPSP
jgi:hypothetical protein